MKASDLRGAIMRAFRTTSNDPAHRRYVSGARSRALGHAARGNARDLAIEIGILSDLGLPAQPCAREELSALSKTFPLSDSDRDLLVYALRDAYADCTA